ncbi:hypothetical protein GGR50DRAFT_197995 [Xylaria sp. CBS 124048]|nr:hypothetical protein GGR50DRAFT_197995 [Xylaria sp. CBS 124048]
MPLTTPEISGNSKNVRSNIPWTGCYPRVLPRCTRKAAESRIPNNSPVHGKGVAPHKPRGLSPKVPPMNPGATILIWGNSHLLCLREIRNILPSFFPFFLPSFLFVHAASTRFLRLVSELSLILCHLVFRCCPLSPLLFFIGKPCDIQPIDNILAGFSLIIPSCSREMTAMSLLASFLVGPISFDSYSWCSSANLHFSFHSSVLQIFPSAYHTPSHSSVTARHLAPLLALFRVAQYIYHQLF